MIWKGENTSTNPVPTQNIDIMNIRTKIELIRRSVLGKLDVKEEPFSWSLSLSFPSMKWDLRFLNPAVEPILYGPQILALESDHQ